MKKLLFLLLFLLVAFSIQVDCGNCPKCDAPGFFQSYQPTSHELFAACRDAYMHSWLVRLK